MAKYDKATWDPINGSSGAYVAGPFRIVHHTTEGSSYAGARAAYAANKSDPHFTVDATGVWQHIDTSVAARALRAPADQPPTNKLSAVSIEVVAFAGKPKPTATLGHLAALSRWLELTHGILPLWPNGHPRPPKNGQDPGGHNRDAVAWVNRGGHYGHCHVPGNTHWDPAYTAAEVAIVMGTGTLKSMGEEKPLTNKTAPKRASPQRKKVQRAKMTRPKRPSPPKKKVQSAKVTRPKRGVKRRNA